MSSMTKEKLVSYAVNTAVVLMALAIPFGAVMAYYTNNTSWLWLCMFLLIFLS